MLFRSRLEAVLNGKEALRPEEVSSDHECEFGKWYYGPQGQALNNRPAYAEVGAHHAQVHQYARQIAELVKQGNKAQAETMMQEFERVREAFFKAMDELYLGQGGKVGRVGGKSGRMLSGDLGSVALWLHRAFVLFAAARNEDSVVFMRQAGFPHHHIVSLPFRQRRGDGSAVGLAVNPRVRVVLVQNMGHVVDHGPSAAEIKIVKPRFQMAIYIVGNIPAMQIKQGGTLLDLAG